LIEAIALQIHYYNHKRIHSALKMPPTIFYQRCWKRQRQQNITNKSDQNFNQNSEKNCALCSYLKILR